jgi:predicted dehydrogenase
MESGNINVGLIGYGYWGRNILRNLSENPSSGAIAVCDTNPAQLNAIKSIFSPVHTTTDAKELLSDKNVNAVIIATPTSTHFDLAKKALIKGKHVLVEKPLTTSIKETEELIDIATEQKRVLMVDHIFLYNPVVRQLKKYITQDHLGKINYIDATRINLGIYQTDTNVLWDLACHDISVINFLIEEKPHGVRAIGRINPVHGIEDLAYLFLYYPSGMLVQINSSWASPVKIRKMIIGGEKRMVIYDEIESTNKLIIYDYESAQTSDDNKLKLIDYRLGNITIPKYELSEALKNVISEFYSCIQSSSKPLSDGKNGLEVITILEKAQESLKANGAIISIS